jgi:hypothetical protein
MSEVGEESNNLLQYEIKYTLDRGYDYAKAILVLDPDLSKILDDDIAFGYNVGSGADVVAFKELGFKKSIVTNNQGVLYRFISSESANRENEILKHILKDNAPQETQFSSLFLSDWTTKKGFSPRLLTILTMEPSCFSDDGTMDYADEIIKIHKLNPKTSIVLSALDDHGFSNKAFENLGKTLEKEGVNHQLYIDTIPQELRWLGHRILSIRGI